MTGSFTARLTALAASLVGLGFTLRVGQMQGAGGTACAHALLITSLNAPPFPRFGLPFVLHLEKTIAWDILQKEILEKMQYFLRPAACLQVRQTMWVL